MRVYCNRIYLSEVELLKLYFRVINLKCFELLFVLQSFIFLRLSYNGFGFVLNFHDIFLLCFFDFRISFNLDNLFCFFLSHYYRVFNLKDRKVVQSVPVEVQLVEHDMFVQLHAFCNKIS